MDKKNLEIVNSYGNSAYNNFGIQIVVVEQSCFHSVILKLDTVLEKYEKLTSFMVPFIVMLAYVVWIVYAKQSYFNSGTILDVPLNLIRYISIYGAISLGMVAFYIMVLTLFSKSR